MTYMESKDFFVIVTINVPRPGLPNATLTWQGNVTASQGTPTQEVYDRVVNEAMRRTGIVAAPGEWSCTFFSMTPATVTW